MCTDPNLPPLVSPRSVLQSGQNMKIVVPSAGIWGTASVEGANLDRHNAGKEQAASQHGNALPTFLLTSQYFTMPLSMNNN